MRVQWSAADGGGVTGRKVAVGGRVWDSVKPNWKEVQVQPVQQVAAPGNPIPSPVSGLLLPEVGSQRAQLNLVLNPRMG